MDLIGVEEFDRVDVRVGTITGASLNKKARHPAYKLMIDFGEEIGVKLSSAQITDLYQPADLVGRQVVCCVNLTPLRIGDVRSDVRILGADTPEGVVLLQPSRPVANGDRIF
ncbi:MAG: tRNA-binding protein [Oscillospiraceae bacterium]